MRRRRIRTCSAATASLRRRRRAIEARQSSEESDACRENRRVHVIHEYEVGVENKARKRVYYGWNVSVLLTYTRLTVSLFWLG